MKIIHVVAAIITNDHKIFATQRGYGDFKGGWEFPGGKIEPGETGEEALIREIEEELDTEIDVGEKLIDVEYDYPTFHLSLSCYMCTVREGHLTLLEHSAAKWLDKNHLDDVDWLPADHSIIDKLRAMDF